MAIAAIGLVAVLGGGIWLIEKSQSASLPSTVSAAPPAEPDASPSPDLRQQATDLWNGFSAAVATCDDAGDRAKTAMKEGDRIVAYTASAAARDACLETPHSIRKLAPPPAADSQTQARFRETLDNCVSAYAAKWGSYRRMVGILDGDDRPSKIADAERMMDLANAGLAQCVPTMMTLIREAGAVAPGPAR
jgi:hypothetical protein